MVNRYQEVQGELKSVEEKMKKQKVKGNLLDEFLIRLRNIEEIITEFDETLWNSMVDSMVVENDRLRFVLKDGRTEEIMI